MKTLSSHKVRQIATEIISLFFIILFMYAAFSKLLDYDVFVTQLEQSPFLSSTAGLIAWGIPVLEIIIALLFFFPGFRLLGFYASFVLMSIFTIYIIAVLNFADSIPCSCGGVINSLSWNEHLIFNVACVIVALLGVVLWKNNMKSIKNKKHQFTGYEPV